MAVSPLNLTIALTTDSACTALYVADVTGVVGTDGNTDGYDISGGPSHDDVTTCTVVCTYNSAGTYITYEFTLVNHAITACTLAIQAGTPADIFSELTSTAWPFTTTTPFNLFGDYGVSIPEFIDEIYTVEYTIEGEVTLEAFTFDTLANKSVVCASQCCIDKKFLGIDWSCECASEEIKKAMYGQALINNVLAAEDQTGDLSAGIGALNKVKSVCDSTEGGCGCA